MLRIYPFEQQKGQLRHRYHKILWPVFSSDVRRWSIYLMLATGFNPLVLGHTTDIFTGRMFGFGSKRNSIITRTTTVDRTPHAHPHLETAHAHAHAKDYPKSSTRSNRIRGLRAVSTRSFGLVEPEGLADWCSLRQSTIPERRMMGVMPLRLS